MNELGVALATITGLRVYDFPAASIAVPAGVVAWPSSLQWDSVYGRGADRATFEVIVLIGAQNDRNARDQLSDYLSGSGSKSVKAAIEAAAVGDSVRVTQARVEVRTVGAQDYLAATFDVDVIA